MKTWVFGAKEISIVVFSALFLFLVTDMAVMWKNEKSKGAGRDAQVYRYQVDPGEPVDIVVHKQSFCEGEQILIEQFSAMTASSEVESHFARPVSTESLEESGEKHRALAFNVYARTVKPSPCVAIAPKRIEEPLSISGALPVYVYFVVEDGLKVETVYQPQE